jgi:hypothetical protein
VVGTLNFFFCFLLFFSRFYFYQLTAAAADPISQLPIASFRLSPHTIDVWRVGACAAHSAGHLRRLWPHGLAISYFIFILLLLLLFLFLSEAFRNNRNPIFFK